MNTTWVLLGPFVVLFAAALAIAIIQRRTRDSCLKQMNGSYVLIQTKQKKWIYGQLQVFPKALVVDYCVPHKDPRGYNEYSFIFYEENIEEIRMILSPIARIGTPEHREWLNQVQRLRHPPLTKIALRKLRIVFNMIRDAFAQSISMLVGVFKQKTAMGKIAGAEQQATQFGQKLLSVIPNSYEPALELYLSKDVAVETFFDSQPNEQVGILEEYSEKFLLLRDVYFPEEPEWEGLRAEDERNHFTVAFPRKQAIVRHFVKRDENLGLAPREPETPVNALPKAHA